MTRRACLRAAAGGACALVLTLAGCALTPPSPSTTGPRWSGRLALQVQGRAEGSFSAGFELRGSPAAGELSLYTPLGASAALLEWGPGRASLRVPGQPEREAGSLDDLLAGTPTSAEGWQADLSQHASGRLRASRLDAPAADLRIVLEGP